MLKKEESGEETGELGSAQDMEGGLNPLMM